MKQNSLNSVTPAGRTGFTLIELLVVIAVIAILAAMIIPISGAVNRNKVRAKASAELATVESAIENYKTKLGHYPPDNPNSAAVNSLYYELNGTTASRDATGKPAFFETLDTSASISVADLNTYFGSGGIINSTRGNAEEGRSGIKFLNPPLKPQQIGTYNNARIIISSIRRSDGSQIPFSYVSSAPVHNRGSFDLWIDVVIDNQTNRVSNWSKKPEIIR